MKTVVFDSPVVMSIDQWQRIYVTEPTSAKGLAAKQVHQLQNLFDSLNQNEWKHRLSASLSYENLQRAAYHYENNPDLEVPRETINLFKTAIEHLRQYA